MPCRKTRFPAKRKDERDYRIMAENTGKSVEEVTAACERDNFMTSDEAKEFGLIDRVLERH